MDYILRRQEPQTCRKQRNRQSLAKGGQRRSQLWLVAKLAKHTVYDGTKWTASQGHQTTHGFNLGKTLCLRIAKYYLNMKIGL